MDGQRKALIVANDEYEHEGLKQLFAPAADAEALARVLGDERIGDFDVQVVRNEPAHVVQLEIEEFFKQGRSNDVLLLHFSCHGLKGESGELFFAARNTRPNRLDSTTVPAHFVQRCMRASRSRSVVLFLDCCYGGAFGEGVSVRAAGDVNVLDSFPQEKAGGGRGRAVITASGAMQYAFEGDQLATDRSPRPSLFTSALVEGLDSGEADRNEDGWVSLNELYDYVYDRVSEQTPDQTPGRDIKMEGELYLARSRQRRIQPLPTPPLLAAAIADPNPFTRHGAVAELRLRLLGDNLPAAAGACDELAGIARTDIQYLADAAASALAEAAVRTAEPELHFGKVVRDAPPAHRTVHLLGPPLARACTFHASHGWIHVKETPEGLDVRADTAQPGAWRGNIVLKGRCGEAVIPVQIDVTEGPGLASPPDPTLADAGAASGSSSAGREVSTRPAPPLSDLPPGTPTEPGLRPPAGGFFRRRTLAILASGAVVVAAAGLAGLAALSLSQDPPVSTPSPTVTSPPTASPTGSPTPPADPQFYFSGLVTTAEPLPPQLENAECVVVVPTEVTMRGPVKFTLEPGYHLRSENTRPYNCNIRDDTPLGLWKTCEAYDAAGNLVELPPGPYELVATGSDTAGTVHTARVSVTIAKC